MSKQIVLLFSISIATICPLCADVAPAYVPIEYLYQNSDAVVVGHCDAVHTLTGNSPFTTDYYESFSVMAAYKGEVAGTFVISFPQRPIAAGVPACGQMYWLLFLKQTDYSGTYLLSDRHYGMRTVTSSFVKSAEAVTATGNGGLSALQDTLAQVASTADAGEAMEALRVLRLFDQIEPTTLPILMTLSQGSDPSKKLLALEMLSRVNPVYFGPYTEAFKSQTVRDSDLFTHMCEIASRGTTPNQLAQLEDMADWQTYPGLRECAMDGIRRLRMRASVPFLISHVNDAQWGVAHLAIMTLAEITGLRNGDYAPGVGPFLADPQKYENRWQEWWNTVGSAKYSNPQ